MSEASKQRFFKLLSIVQQGDLDHAEAALAQALRSTPKAPNILHLAAQLAEKRQDTEKAAHYYERALQVLPNWFEAGMNLARVLSRQKKDKNALALLATLKPRHPQRFEIDEAMARIHQTNGNLPQASKCWQDVLSIKPNHLSARGQLYFCLRQVCDWKMEPVNPQVPSPQITTILSDDPTLQKEAAIEYIARHFASISPLPLPAPYQHKRKRIGYLSSDFHAHATSWLMAELFRLHNKDKFEVFVYSYGIDDGSIIRARLIKEAEHFVVLNDLTPLGCAQKIREDEIDILIDLKGHTHGARLDILAYRPAPVQLHWLGYPATIGAPFIDGFIADRVTVPLGTEAFFTEKVYRLPHSYQINDRQKSVGPRLNKSDYGLPQDAFVLASFNQTYKITPEIFSLWCDILHAEPRTVLWLFESNLYAPNHLRQEAQKRGIDPSQLFFAKSTAQEEHLARYYAVDLALDTFPVGGHTTTSDALWVGAPVITMAGKSFVSRVAASLLAAVNLPELITATREEYKIKAISLINDDKLRTSIHEKLVNERDTLPLFDTPRFVADLETLLLNIG